MQTTKASPGRWGIWCEVQLAMDGLPCISHILWIHGKGIISLGYNPYIGMPSIQAMDHQSYGSRFYRSCKPLNHSQGGVGCDMMYQWTWMGCHHILLMHMNDLISLECNLYTGMTSIQATDLPRCEQRARDDLQTTKPSTGRCGMWSDVQVTMDRLAYISHVL